MRQTTDLDAARGIIRSVGISVCFWAIIGLMIWAATSSLAGATPPKNRSPHNRPPNGQESSQTQTQEATARSQSQSDATSKSISEAAASATGGSASAQGGAGGAGGAAQATNDGVSTSVNSEYRSESNNTNVVLVPNNNTSNCMRVWGISFGTSEGAAGLGLPTRDASCDFEQAADDAAALGQHDIAWFWRCHKKNLYKQFQNGSTKETAVMKCFSEMTHMLDPAPVGKVVIPEEEYQNLLMAQVQQEEVEQVQKELEKQEDLIESLKEDHEDKQAEIERLRREAARLRAEQAEIEKKDAARRAAALKAISKKDEGD